MNPTISKMTNIDADTGMIKPNPRNTAVGITVANTNRMTNSNALDLCNIAHTPQYPLSRRDVLIYDQRNTAPIMNNGSERNVA